MKRNLLFFAIVALLALAASCSKSGDDDRFEIITGQSWQTDSLLVDGQDASQPGQILHKFKGEARFNRDATGTFGQYSGTWRFTNNRTALEIKTDSLPIPLLANIVELTKQSLKITTAYPHPEVPNTDMKIRMTFKAR
ncbi:MAG: hypothetical protein IPM52_09405 [Bacteroidetes bacterium]|nr:hypothetical protein [Bacteroidota bacterium]